LLYLEAEDDFLTTDMHGVLSVPLKVAENTTLALQYFAKTGNISYLLVVQRHLIEIQDDNGDK
jgi:hypothetical protein